MAKENFKLLIVVLVFLALLILLAWPAGVSVDHPSGTDPTPSHAHR